MKQKESKFRVEVDLLRRLDHPNLVNLIGYCADGKHIFLAYEYMHKGNLEDHLNGIRGVKMDWPLRLKVDLGAATGLAYLHSNSAVGIPIAHRDFKSTNILLHSNYEAGIPIAHRDFKSTNILLDSNYEAMISDFGLAKLMPKGQERPV